MSTQVDEFKVGRSRKTRSVLSTECRTEVMVWRKKGNSRGINSGSAVLRQSRCSSIVQILDSKT